MACGGQTTSTTPSGVARQPDLFLRKTPFRLVVRQHPPHRRSFIQGTAALASSSLAENSVDFQSVRFFSVKYLCQRAPAIQSPQFSLFTFPSSKIIPGLFRTLCIRQNSSSVTSWLLGGTRPSVHSAATESPEFQAHSCGWVFSFEQKTDKLQVFWSLQ